MTNETIHWYDLDGTLWDTDAKWWIINKKNPSTYILRIPSYVGSLILSGHYSSQGHKIYYNGLNGWLPQDLWNKIHQRNINIEDVGISFREFSDVDLIEKQAENLIFYIDRIKHLSGTKDIINLLTARSNRKTHDALVDKLHTNLEPHNIYINDAVFVNDPTHIKFVGTIADKKMICILQNIIGYEINSKEILPIATDKYNNTFFYDDDETNINTCKEINKLLIRLLENTVPWLKQNIIEDLHTRKPKLYLEQVTTNELNPFIETIVNIEVD